MHREVIDGPLILFSFKAHVEPVGGSIHLQLS